jgi:hypothetical protein
VKYLKHKILKIFLLNFFLVYIISNALFTHSHEINGVKITHFHFFNLFSNTSQNSITHEHSEMEIKTIDILNHTFLACVLIFSIIFAFKIFYKRIKHQVFTTNFHHLFLLDTKNLRAPPLFTNQ